MGRNSIYWLNVIIPLACHNDGYKMFECKILNFKAQNDTTTNQNISFFIQKVLGVNKKYFSNSLEVISRHLKQKNYAAHTVWPCGLFTDVLGQFASPPDAGCDGDTESSYTPENPWLHTW